MLGSIGTKVQIRSSMKIAYSYSGRGFWAHAADRPMYDEAILLESWTVHDLHGM